MVNWHYRCTQGNCKKISSNMMIQENEGNCYNCGFRQFSGLGKYHNWETVIVLIRNWFAEKSIKKEKKC